MPSSPLSSVARATTLRARLAAVTVVAIAPALLLGGLGAAPATAATPAAASGTGTFLSSFEQADPQPQASTPVGTPRNISGQAYPNGSLLGSVATISASAENAPGEVAANLADLDPDTKWLAFATTADIVYAMSKPVVLKQYTLTSGGDAPERDPKAFDLQGSTDGTTWTTIDSRADQAWATRGLTRTFTTTNTTAYSSYRLHITANGSGGILQLGGWEPQDGTSTPPAASPMTAVVGSGPTAGYNMKPDAGFSGVKSLRYAGRHLADGTARAVDRLFRLGGRSDTPAKTIATGDELSYRVFPDFTTDLSYSSTYVAVDLLLSDGTRMSTKGLVDGNGFGADARSQGRQKALYASQWNAVSVDLSSLAGRSVTAIDLVYDDPDGSATTTFSGWVDDIRIAPAPTQDTSSPVMAVDTRRGTLSSGSFSRGNNIPAAAVPNGFNFFTPMTNATTDSWLYDYASDNDAANLPELEAIGISHEPSPWMGDRDQLAILPAASATPLGDPDARKLEFSHANEIARPDLYSVGFTNGMAAEVTPTDHGGVYRFRYTGDTGSVILDKVVGDAKLQVAADGSVTGWVDGGSGLSAGRSRMFVQGAFSEKPTAVGTTADRSSARYAAFDTAGDKVVELRIATSFLSQSQAKHNLDLEVSGRRFDDVQGDATRAWNAKLGVIEVEGATPAQRTTLYSNLYRMNLYPNSQTENVGTDAAPVYRYASPVAPQSGQATDTRTNAAVKNGSVYVNNGFWDTYRTVWPAYSLLYPKTEQTLVDGFVQQYRDAGWVARWSSPGYADLMTGTSSDVAFADAYINGALDTATALDAYDAALKNATVLPTSSAIGRKGLDTSTFLGYTPATTGESVSWGLEGLVNDYGIGRMAAKLVDDPAVPASRKPQLKEESQYFLTRAESYGNLFDEQAGFFQARNADGTWHVPSAEFDPQSWGDAFTETDGWNFAFHAPFDVDGLAAQYGGTKGLLAKLDQFFATPETATDVGGYGGVIHEMREARDVRMGQLGMSNQVSHHIPYMYAAAGQPSKTQAAVREILQRLFVGSEIGQGYAGDEDNGETSAWYVFSALGFYPEAVGSGTYVIGSPLFTKATVHLQNGKDLVIEAPNNSTKNVYVRSLSFDGKAVTQATVDQKMLASGGTLRFGMSAKPTTWGDRTGNATKRVPLVDATKPEYGTTTVSDGTDDAGLTDDNSRSATTFASSTPTVTWDSATGPVKVGTYTLTDGATGAAPAAWTLEGSADGESWITLDQRTDERFPNATQTRPFQVAEPGQYAHYRLTITGTTSGKPATVSEFELLADPTAAPSDFALSATPGVTGRPGTPVTGTLATLSGGTSSSAADYTATVDFLDGKGPQKATLTRSALGAWQVSAAHAFDAAGTYSATVTVTEGMKQASVSATITIARDDSLTGAFDSVCLGDPGGRANCDQVGFSFGRQKLADTGFVQGTTIQVPGTGLTFDLPEVATDQPDNATGDGQTIAFDAGTGATQLSVIGTATEKAQQTVGTITFTDGTTASLPIEYGDWTGSSAAPMFGDIVVGSSAGRLQSSGEFDGGTAAIFATPPVGIPAGKQVASITLPEQTGSATVAGRIHVFAIATDGDRAASAAPLAASGVAVADQVAGTTFTTTLAATTGGSGSDRTATVNWGDGTATTAGPVSSGTVSGTHSYPDAGDYTVTVTVDDGVRSVATTTTIAVTAAPAPAATLTGPTSVLRPGDPITMTGAGFAAGERVDLVVTPTPHLKAAATADSTGAFSVSATVPADSVDGTYPIVATGATSGLQARTTVRVEAAPAAPAIRSDLRASVGEAQPGQRFTVDAVGLEPGEPVTLTLRDTAVADLTADGDGVLRAPVAVPAEAATGSADLVLTGAESGRTATTAVRILGRAPAAVTGTAPLAPGRWRGALEGRQSQAEVTASAAAAASTRIAVAGGAGGVLALLAAGVAVVLIVRRRKRRA